MSERRIAVVHIKTLYSSLLGASLAIGASLASGFPPSSETPYFAPAKSRIPSVPHISMQSSSYVNEILSPETLITYPSPTLPVAPDKKSSPFCPILPASLLVISTK